MSTPFQADRRHFLRRSGAAAVAGAIGPWAMNLGALAEAAAAQAPGDDYKALVCVFLQGGNDHGNTLVPYDTASHAQYLAARGEVAIDRAQLHATVLAPANAPPGGRQLAMAPAMVDLHQHFVNEDLAVLLNIGPLLRPTTLADVRANRSLPPKLFSHNDQQAVWQSFQPEGGSLTGWGGLIGEQALPPVGSRSVGDILACVNLSGNASFLNGDTTSQYMVNPMGIAPLMSDQHDLFGVAGLSSAFEALSVNVPASSHWMARQHAQVMRRAREVSAELRAAMDRSGALIRPLPAITSAAEYEEQRVALQLNMVARLIEARQALGVRRQVFFVTLGGFDHHDRLSTLHPVLLQRVAKAMAAFQADLVTLGVSEQVTTFTASDFGRTMNSNGDGSDHGWGSHHVVMGGAVRGGRFYGQLPDVIGGDTDIGQGRLLPTMSVDHLAAALARWMGVTDAAALARIAPNLANWSGRPDPLSGLLA